MKLILNLLQKEINMSEGYSTELTEGQEIYIPVWSPTVALANLTQVSKILRSALEDEIPGLEVPTAIISIMEAEDAEAAADIVKHFVMTARMDGHKITKNNYDELFANDLYLAMEIFTHVIHSQYSDFFKRGLAKVNYQES